MKKHFSPLMLFALLASAPAFTQSTRLLIAKSSVSFGQDGVTPTSRDSTTYQYDTAHRLTEQVFWDAQASNPLVPYSREQDFVYDSDGNLLSQITQKFFGGTLWENYLRNSYTYDTAGLLLSYLGEQWANNNWVFESGVNWTYDSNGNPLTLTTQDGQRVIYVYNAEALIESETSQVLFNGNWRNQDRKIYQYNLSLSAKPTGYTIQIWTGTIWVDYHKSTFTYDANGDMTEELLQDWTNSTWVNNYHSTYAYDSNHNRVYYLLEQWLDGAWKAFYREYSSYDNLSNILTKKVEVRPLSTWIPNIFYRYHYADFVGLTNPEALAFSVFPNPAGSSITLKGADLKLAMIFDAQGQLVGSKSLHGQEEASFPLGNLPDGSYFLQVRGADGKTGTKPFQIRH